MTLRYFGVVYNWFNKDFNPEDPKYWVVYAAILFLVIYII